MKIDKINQIKLICELIIMFIISVYYVALMPFILHSNSVFDWIPFIALFITTVAFVITIRELLIGNNRLQNLNDEFVKNNVNELRYSLYRTIRALKKRDHLNAYYTLSKDSNKLRDCLKRCKTLNLNQITKAEKEFKKVEQSLYALTNKDIDDLNIIIVSMNATKKLDNLLDRLNNLKGEL